MLTYLKPIATGLLVGIILAAGYLWVGPAVERAGASLRQSADAIEQAG